MSAESTAMTVSLLSVNYQTSALEEGNDGCVLEPLLFEKHLMVYETLKPNHWRYSALY